MRCEGCREFTTICSFISMGSVAINECPCTKCLIKIMCETPCDKFKEHYHNTFKRINEECANDADTTNIHGT